MEVATEARMLAANFDAGMTSIEWTGTHSRATTLASPIDFGDVGKGSWRETCSTMVSQGSSSQGQATSFGATGSMPNFI